MNTIWTTASFTGTEPIERNIRACLSIHPVGQVNSFPFKSISESIKYIFGTHRNHVIKQFRHLNPNQMLYLARYQVVMRANVFATIACDWPQIDWIFWSTLWHASRIRHGPSRKTDNYVKMVLVPTLSTQNRIHRINGMMCGNSSYGDVMKGILESVIFQ